MTDVKFLKIGELSKLVKLSNRTIRYYEELGLITPSIITNGGMRLFTMNNVHRLEIINIYKDLGLELNEIKQILPLTTGKTKSEMLKNSRIILKTQVAKIDQEISSLERIKDMHLKHLELLDICENCKKDKCPPGCKSKEAYI